MKITKKIYWGTVYVTDGALVTLDESDKGYKEHIAFNSVNAIDFMFKGLTEEQVKNWYRGKPCREAFEDAIESLEANGYTARICNKNGVERQDVINKYYTIFKK